MEEIDREYTRHPFLGSPRMTQHLRRQDYAINPKRIARLMRLMGLAAVGPRPGSRRGGAESRKYPYLLREVRVERPNQAWCSDITYIAVRGGFFYLVAVMDWFSRCVLSWELSNSLDSAFCLSALGRALKQWGAPEIFNTDQGSQFTCAAFTDCLEGAGARVSQAGVGRCFDNIFVERLWRTVKYEEVYLKDYADGGQACSSLRTYFGFYNLERPHSALGGCTPLEAYRGGGSKSKFIAPKRALAAGYRSP